MSSGLTPEQAGVLEATKHLHIRQLDGYFTWLAAQGITEDSDDGAIQSATDMEKLVSDFYKQEKAKTEASRRIAGESYTGTTELTWDNLADATQSYLVDELVPDDAIVFLVARGNMGKTFAYVDMVCRMACGMPWLGKQTRQAKSLIILGEGKNGFVGRLIGWCEANGKTLDDLKAWLFFIDGANVNNDESMTKVKAVADREAVELIVWDTYAATSGVAKEEDPALNSITMNRAVALRPGATNLFVHHPRKAEEDSNAPVMRGSSALYGRADVVMTMYEDKSYRPSTGEKYKFIALSTETEHKGKNRTAGTETLRGLFLDDTTDSRVLQQIASASMRAHTRKVQEHLTRSMTVAEFAAAAGVTPDTARRMLNEAVEDAVAAREKGAGAKPDKFTPLGNVWLGLMGAAES